MRRRLISSCACSAAAGRAAASSARWRRAPACDCAPRWPTASRARNAARARRPNRARPARCASVTSRAPRRSRRWRSRRPRSPPTSGTGTTAARAVQGGTASATATAAPRRPKAAAPPVVRMGPAVVREGAARMPASGTTRADPGRSSNSAAWRPSERSARTRATRRPRPAAKRAGSPCQSCLVAGGIAGSYRRRR